MADYMDWSEDLSDAFVEHDVDRYLRDKILPVEPNELLNFWKNGKVG